MSRPILGKVMFHGPGMTNAQELKGKRFDRSLARRAWPFARPYRRLISAVLCFIVIGALLDLVPPLLFRAIIDTAIPQKRKGFVTTLSLLIVAGALAEGGLALARRWCSSRVGEGLIYTLRATLFDKVQRMPLAFFTRTQTGALISRLNNDVVGAQRAVTGTLEQVVQNSIILITGLTAMLWLEWRLTLLALVVLPIFVVPAKRIGRRLSVLFRESMNLNASMNTQMTERFNVSGAQLVKLYGRYPDELAAFDARASAVRDIGVKSAMLGRVFFVGLSVAGAVGAAALYGVGGHLAINGSVTPGTLVALVALAMRVYQPLTALTNARIDIMTAMVSFERVFELLDAPVAIDDAPAAVDLVAPTGRVDFDAVSFRYPDAANVSVASLERPGSTELPTETMKEVLRGIDLHIEPGQLVALVGPSGAGKTTMAALVSRLYDVTAGCVRLDGHDVRQLTMASVAAAVGTVPQDPHLFHESIAENLRYAKSGATIAEMRAACEAAQIGDVIAALPEGYDTVVGERGYRLSGGEKQRLAIARMLLKNPAVVILDEATSHLDSENEAAVQAALDVALTGRTSIVIAHRLSTIRSADVICVIDDGQIVERGRHDELIARGGLYADLYRTLTGNPSGDPSA